MAKIKCSECGMELDEALNACPNCGCPIDDNQERNHIVKNMISQAVPDTGKKRYKILAIIMFVISILWLIDAYIGDEMGRDSLYSYSTKHLAHTINSNLKALYFLLAGFVFVYLYKRK